MRKILKIKKILNFQQIVFVYLFSAHWATISRHCDFIETNFLERALASVLILVYSNHSTFGIKVVSRINKNSDNRLEQFNK